MAHPIIDAEKLNFFLFYQAFRNHITALSSVDILIVDELGRRVEWYFCGHPSHRDKE